LKFKENGKDLYRMWQIAAENVYHREVPPEETARIEPGRGLPGFKQPNYNNIAPGDALHILTQYLCSLDPQVSVVYALSESQYHNDYWQKRGQILEHEVGFFIPSFRFFFTNSICRSASVESLPGKSFRL
jgi:hypothetical protein